MKFHHPAVPIVLSAVLIDSIGFGIVMPVLPRLIVELGQVSLPEATRIGGYMLVAYALAQFVAGPIVGSLGDSFGRRKVILLSMLAFSGDYALMAVAPTVGWLFLGRIVAGLAGAVYGPANAVLADVTPPEKRGQVFSLMGAAFGAGFIIGPALGGLLAAWGHRAPFIAAAVIAGLNALWIMALLPETMPRERRRTFQWGQAHIIGAFRPILHAGGAGWLLAAAFLWQLGHMVYPATWAFWAELALGWDEKAIGLSLAAAGVAMVVVQAFLTGRTIKRFGEEKTVIIGMAVAALAFIGFAFARQGWMVYALILISAFQGFVFPSINALLSRMADPSHQGALQGGVQSLGSVAAIFSPLVLTQVLAFGAERGFVGGNFVAAALLSAGALLIVAIKVLNRVPPAPVAQ